MTMGLLVPKVLAGRTQVAVVVFDTVKDVQAVPPTVMLMIFMKAEPVMVMVAPVLA